MEPLYLMKKGETIGEGTFGITYSAFSPKGGTCYAVKRNLSEQETSFISSVRELDILHKLRKHPNIVNLIKVSFGEPFEQEIFSPLPNSQERQRQRNDKIHFVFEKAEMDLYAHIKLIISKKKTSDFKLMKKFMVDVAIGVNYIHSLGIIHRDLKPSNILIFIKDNKFSAKICDFGLAKPHTYQGFQTPGTVTAWYRSPEIVMGHPHYDFISDIWSLGCVFFEMVSTKILIKDKNGDDDKSLLTTIFKTLPSEVPQRQLRDFRSEIQLLTGKCVEMKIGKNIRSTYETKLSLAKNAKIAFEKNAGPLSDFHDLLNKMLVFNWKERMTSIDVLNHKFFLQFKNKINRRINSYPILTDRIFKIKDCIERKWAYQIAIEVFTNRTNKSVAKWYTHRALFQSLDLFDRYMFAMFGEIKVPTNAIESEFKGLIHSKFDAELRYASCLYLSIKYFSSVHEPVAFEFLLGNSDYTTEKAKLEAEEFESGLVYSCLEYNIYQPTLYETADKFHDTLTESQIEKLLILYGTTPSINGSSVTDIYGKFRNVILEKDTSSLGDLMCSFKI